MLEKLPTMRVAGRTDVAAYILLLAGKYITGKVMATISRGRVVWENNKLHVQSGTGRFIAMRPHGPLFQGLRQQDEIRLRFKYGSTPVKRHTGSVHTESRDEL